MTRLRFGWLLSGLLLSAAGATWADSRADSSAIATDKSRQPPPVVSSRPVTSKHPVKRSHTTPASELKRDPVAPAPDVIPEWVQPPEQPLSRSRRGCPSTPWLTPIQPG
ncbi:MAG: hypothetical protein H7834_04225 [Magnetococcus sp. YQC-9]